MSQNQDYVGIVIRESAALTNAYVVATIVEDSRLNNQLVLAIDFTIAALTYAEILVEEYHDCMDDYFQQSNLNTSGATTDVTPGVLKITTTGKQVVAIPVKSSKVRISARGVGADFSNNLMKIGLIKATA